MDNPQAPNTPERPIRRHTIDVNVQTTAPRYDFVLPSYSRDRRVSSITATVPSETIINENSSNVTIPVSGQNSSSFARTNDDKGIHK